MTSLPGHRLVLLWLALACLPWPCQGEPAAAPVVDVFVRQGCPHCAEARRYLGRLQEARPRLSIQYHAVDTDEQARDTLIARTKAAGQWPPGVPAFAVGETLLIGFDPTATPAALVAALERAAAAGTPAAVSRRLPESLNVERLGLPVFTLALGLIDGFNPCAMWVLLFLLSLLVRLRDRRRLALVAGCFVLVSGAVYYAFMAAWLNLFLAVGLNRPLQLGLATVALFIGVVNVKDWIAFGRGPSFSIPTAARPGLYARMRGVLNAPSLAASLLGVTALAVAVNLVELLCTAGLPALYTAVLAQQDLSGAAWYAYLGLYILGYIADDALMVGTAVFALGSRRLSEAAGRRLKLLSGVVMIALAMVMLLRPDWLQ